MSGHSDAIDTPRQQQFQQWLRELRLQLSWGQIWREGRLEKWIPGDQYHDAGSRGSRYEILKHAYGGRASEWLYEAIRQLHKTHTRMEEKMNRRQGTGSVGTRGTRLSPREMVGMRQLIKTLRQRGYTTTRLATESGLSAPSISIWLHDRSKAITESSRDRILMFMRQHVTGAEELIAEAFNGAVPETAVEEPEVVLPKPIPSASFAGLAPYVVPETLTFARIKALLEQARSETAMLCEGMPRVAREAVEKNVVAFIDSAIGEF